MKLMILDGNSIINRAFYGIRMLNAPDGTPTNGVYGFLNILQKLMGEEAPEAVCVAFDLAGPTFRHERYEQYKAQRKPMPEELAAQMPVLKEALDAMGVRRYELEGYEADDLIGTAVRLAELEGCRCLIVTGDRDSLQLITDQTHVRYVTTRKGRTETTLYSPGSFYEEYGFGPEKMIDFKALMGDPSDNIPGVPGVGERTALDLIRRFGGIEEIYGNLPELDIKEGVRNRLREGEASARLSFDLAAICAQAPLPFAVTENSWSRQSYTPGLYELFKRLGFNSFIEKWDISEAGAAAPAGATPGFPLVEVKGEEQLRELAKQLADLDYVSVLAGGGDLKELELCDGKSRYTLHQGANEKAFEDFLRLLFCDKVKKVSANVKDLLRLLMTRGIQGDGFLFDVALAEYLLDPTASAYEMRRIADKYAVAQEGAGAAFLLYPELDKRLKELGMERLYHEIEFPLCLVLAEMEEVGFRVDKETLFAFGEGLNERIERLQQMIWAEAGEEFNINSPKQLGAVLFDKLLLPHGRKTKTGWSTSAAVLDKLVGKHPIVSAVLDYRQLAKLKSTYADGLLKVIAPDGRIHTSFQMTVTATGRLSSVEPNLQNIPVRTELGGEIRKMFVAGEGNVLVDADYSQIELRLLAHISEDETMKNAFSAGEDIHTVTASQVFGVAPEEVTWLMRSRAKAVNFGIVYGISDFSLAQDIDVSRQEAREYMDSYLSKYSGVRDYMQSIVAQAKEAGYVSTHFGRRRWLPELKSSNFNERSFGERVALNMPIQGTAADIIKLAMVNVRRSMLDQGLKARLILQVHDELIVECPENEAETVKALLVGEMQSAVSLSVPLVVEANSGKSWHEAK